MKHRKNINPLYLNQPIMHLFYSSLYITFFHVFRLASAPSSESLM